MVPAAFSLSLAFALMLVLFHILPFFSLFPGIHMICDRKWSYPINEELQNLVHDFFSVFLLVLVW